MGNDNSREYRVKGAGTNLKGSVDDFAQRNDKDQRHDGDKEKKGAHQRRRSSFGDMPRKPSVGVASSSPAPRQPASPSPSPSPSQSKKPERKGRDRSASNPPVAEVHSPGAETLVEYLPLGWVAMKTPQGRRYYACTKEKRTYWQVPWLPSHFEMMMKLPSRVPVFRNIKTGILQSNPPLPPGMKYTFDPNDGRPLVVDPNGNVSGFHPHHPEILRAALGTIRPNATAEEKRQQEEELKKKVEEENKERELCVVCMDQEMNCVILRCGHMCVCETCGKALKTCPICRGDITEVVKVYKA